MLKLFILGGRIEKPLCKNFEAKEGMGVYSRWAYFREGTVVYSLIFMVLPIKLIPISLTLLPT